MKPCAMCGLLPIRNKARAFNAKRVRAININKLHKRAVTILDRQVERLLLSSAEGKLPEDDAKLLISYVKLITELKEISSLEDLEKPKSKE